MLDDPLAQSGVNAVQVDYVHPRQDAALFKRFLQDGEGGGDRVLSSKTTCWRLIGTDLDGDELKVAVDLTLDLGRGHVLVATVM